MAKYWRGDEDLDENERERLRLSQGGFDTDLGEDLFFRDTSGPKLTPTAPREILVAARGMAARGEKGMPRSHQS